MGQHGCGADWEDAVPLSPQSSVDDRGGGSVGLSFVDGWSNHVFQQNEKCTVDQGLVTADRDGGADLEVGPARP